MIIDKITLITYFIKTHYEIKYIRDITSVYIFRHLKFPEMEKRMNKSKSETNLIKRENIEYYRKNITLMIEDIEDELLLKKIFQYIHDKYVKPRLF